ncbi:MAG: helix-turn-helix transcriptional regulator [Solirubrobacterales bacterium]|nr:helix-turn-helix transcriptional regulator [Solirubrobacterales bacterium]
MTDPGASLAERFGLNLKRCRNWAELTQGELAERSSLTRQAISLIELGERRPHLESFVSLVAALDLGPVALLDGIGWVPAQKRRSGSYLVAPADQQSVSPVSLATAGPPVSRPGAFYVGGDASSLRLSAPRPETAE